MKPISGRIRSLFPLFTAVSLLVCIAAVVLWNASLDSPDAVSKVVRRWHFKHVELVDKHGHLTIALPTQKELLFRDWLSYLNSNAFEAERDVWSIERKRQTVQAGSVYDRQLSQQLNAAIATRDAARARVGPEPEIDRQLTVSLPAVTLLAALLPAIAVIRARRRIAARLRKSLVARIDWPPARVLSRSERWTRRIFAGAAGASAVLALMLLFMWGRSYLCSDTYMSIAGVPMAQKAFERRFTTQQGGVLYDQGTFPTFPSPHPLSSTPIDYEVLQRDPDREETPRFHKLLPQPIHPKAVNSYGFHFQHARNPATSGFLIVVPFWFLTLCAALLPAIWVLTHRKQATRKGHCALCDYDLTANTSGVCPECGRAVSTGEGDRKLLPLTI